MDLAARSRAKAPRYGVDAKKPLSEVEERLLKMGCSKRGLRLFYETGLDCLYADPDTLDLARSEANADALQVWTELTLGSLRYVRADAATLLSLALAVDD